MMWVLCRYCALNTTIATLQLRLHEGAVRSNKLHRDLTLTSLLFNIVSIRFFPDCCSTREPQMEPITEYIGDSLVNTVPIGSQRIQSNSVRPTA
jgi:hypothetical protein